MLRREIYSSWPTGPAHLLILYKHLSAQRSPNSFDHSYEAADILGRNLHEDDGALAACPSSSARTLGSVPPSPSDKDRHSPMPAWRRRIMWITRICSRCILFSFGYHWIERIGRPVSREIAPIVVSNHISYVEPIFFFYELFPTIVASESHDSIPFVRTIIRAMQVIYVDRSSAVSRKHVVNEIKDLNSEKGFEQRLPSSLIVPRGHHN